MEYRKSWVCACLLLASCLAVGRERVEIPRLVVVIMVDQFRADYLTRFRKHFLPARSDESLGGFNYLLEQGAVYWDAQFSHLSTFTCVGHATLLSGAAPAVSGMIGNSWYDSGSGQWVDCVDDRAPDAAAERSPRLMQVSTVGDELRLSNQGRSKVFSIGYKDYAVISMGGRDASLALWFDRDTGRWVSNAYYLDSDEPPPWVEQFNESGRVDHWRSQPWDRALPETAYRTTRPSHVLAEEKEAGYGYGWSFPHTPEGGTYSYWSLVATPFANDLLLELGLAAVRGEALGGDEDPDILALALSSNDYIGHLFGPSSPEVLDTTVRTDRALAKFFNQLREQVDLDDVVFILSSDHGIQYIPEEVQENRGAGGRLSRAAIRTAVEGSLERQFGAGEWVRAFNGLDLYLNRDLILSKQLEAWKVQRAAVEALSKVPGILTSFAAADIRIGPASESELARRVALSYYAGRSGDVIFIPQPNWFLETNLSTTHGPHYPSNSHVPLIVAGAGVTPGQHYRRVDIRDIAPTLSQLLGIGYPSGSSGKVLQEVFARK